MNRGREQLHRAIQFLGDLYKTLDDDDQKRIAMQISVMLNEVIDTEFAHCKEYRVARISTEKLYMDLLEALDVLIQTPYSENEKIWRSLQNALDDVAEIQKLLNVRVTTERDLKTKHVWDYPSCINCKHMSTHVRKGGSFECYGITDPVFGHFNLCRDNRENQSLCGREGQFFEPKEKDGE